ncbi:MAG: hypothetical protein ACRELG_15775 [Gemmataceae bacterium]
MRGLVAASVRKLRGMFHGPRRGRVVAVGDDSFYLYIGAPPTLLDLLREPSRTVNTMSVPEASAPGGVVPPEPEPWFYCI